MRLSFLQRFTGLLRAAAGMAALLLGWIHGASAQGHAASASANVSSSIIQGIQVTNNSNLRFGAMIPGSGGTVTVGVSGSRSATGSITLLSASSFPFTAATFTLLGAPSQTYSITLPTTATLTRQGGSETVVVGSFASNPSSTGALDASGKGTLAVGGTLTISGSQTAGYYTGQFTITLTYQ